MSSAALDLNSPSFFGDPYPVYARLRAERKPQFQGNSWIVTGYDDVASLLKHPNMTKQLTGGPPMPLNFSMIFQDPPTHTRLRGLVNQAFTPRRVKVLEQNILDTANKIIGGVASRRRMDFMADFAMPFPVTVIAEMLGVPPEDRDTFHHRSVEFVTASDLTGKDSDSGRKQMAAMTALTDYFSELIAKRRRDLKDDILSGLIEAHDDQERMNTEELIGNSILLLIAGHETTTNLFGNGLLTLLRHPELFERIKRDPTLIGGAVEEMLRFESPIQQGTFRVTTASIEASGVTIPQGQQVTAIIGAANRDPEQFPDPDRFDISRNPNRHLSFGLGIHFCLGASLARTEAKIGFTRLMEMLPELRLAREEPGWMPFSVAQGMKRVGWKSPWGEVPAPNWRANTIIRGLKTLPVEW